MKDYLNSEEVTKMLIIAHLVDKLEEYTGLWTKNKFLSAEEHKYFKTAATCTLKGWEHILKRIDINSAEKLDKKGKRMFIRFTDEYAEKEIRSRLDKEINDAYTKEQRLYDLVEITLEHNCQDCHEHGSKCDICKFFIQNNIQEPTGEHFKDKHCRYAYENVMLEKIEKVGE